MLVHLGSPRSKRGKRFQQWIFSRDSLSVNSSRILSNFNPSKGDTVTLNYPNPTIQSHKGFRSSSSSANPTLRFFVKERVVAQEGSDLSTDELASAYFVFCKKRGWTTRPAQTVERELKDLIPEIHGSHATTHLEREGKRARGYKGVALRPEEGANGEEGPA